MERVSKDSPCPPSGLNLRIEVAREGDRWLADVTDLPGVMAYGATRGEAICAVEALALEVLADRLKHEEDLSTGHPSKDPQSGLSSLLFSPA